VEVVVFAWPIDNVEGMAMLLPVSLLSRSTVPELTYMVKVVLVLDPPNVNVPVPFMASIE